MDDHGRHADARLTGERGSAVDSVGGAEARRRTRRQAPDTPPGSGHAAIAGDLMATPGLAVNDVPDVYLAALAIEHGLTLCSTDGDFARFPGLSWRNPLAS